MGWKLSLSIPGRHVGGPEVQLNSFLTSVLDRGEWLTLCPTCLTSRERMTVPTEYVAGLASKPVLKFWRSEISLSPTGIWTPDRLACSLVAIQTTLLQLKIYKYTTSACGVSTVWLKCYFSIYLWCAHEVTYGVPTVLLQCYFTICLWCAWDVAYGVSIGWLECYFRIWELCSSGLSLSVYW
jgi:hypothetical protein